MEPNDLYWWDSTPDCWPPQLGWDGEGKGGGGGEVTGAEGGGGEGGGEEEKEEEEEEEKKGQEEDGPPVAHQAMIVSGWNLFFCQRCNACK